MSRRLTLIIVLILTTVVGGAGGALIGWQSPVPVSRNIIIKARQYAYEPSVIRVNRGDTLHIKLVSLDVMHGFYVEGYDIDAWVNANQTSFKMRHPSQGNEWSDVEELVLITNRTGKFRYRCSHTCGTMHPFMLGELIVEPNTTYHTGVGAIIGIFLGMFSMFAFKSKNMTGKNEPIEES